MTTTENDLAPTDIRQGRYGEKVIAVEPGGAEFIPLNERHGRPLQLFWTWTSPNMEFATIFVGVLCVAAFGLSFTEAALAIALGSAIGGLTQGLLSRKGPAYGVPQMVLSRFGFGYWGNILPAGINAVVAGIGWFAVNSVSGALALNTLTHLPQVGCLVIVVAAQIVVAFFGHNLIHVFERYAFPVLVVIFLITSGVILSKAHAGAGHHTIPGAFLLALGATFGYAVGWNPYASDYTRYMKPDTNRAAIAIWSGLGLFLSCTLLEIVGAGAATIVSAGDALGSNPTGAFTSVLPTALADATLCAIALGAVAANVLNIYSGALSFTALGIRLPLSLRRAIVALGFGTIGFFLAWSGLSNAGSKYDNFLLIIAYWIAPWLAVTFCEQLFRLRQRPAENEHLLFERSYANWAGPVAMAVGMGISIWLFSNQTEYVGVVPRHVGWVGDLTFEAGFVLTTVIYLTWRLLAGRAQVPGRRTRGARGEVTSLLAVSVTVEARLEDRKGPERMAQLAVDAYARIRHLIPEMTKFGVVGAIGAVIDLGGTGVLHGVAHLGPLTSKGTAVLVAMVVTYLGSRFWTFRHRENQALWREAALFFVLNLVGLAIAEAVIAITAYGLGYNGQIAFNVASVIGTGLGTIFRFISYRKWVFLAPASAPPPSAAPPAQPFAPWAPAPRPGGFNKPPIPNGSSASGYVTVAPSARRGTPAVPRGGAPGRHRKRLRGTGASGPRALAWRVARQENREHGRLAAR